VEKAMKEAEVARLWDRLSLPQLVTRYPAHRGARTIRAILQSLTAGDEITKEEMVSLFLSVLDGANLPRPELNRVITVGGRTYECDCVWPEQQVMVELDGYAVHGTRQNFETDRERDRILHANEWCPIRITWRQLRDDPAGVVRDLRRLLTQPANCGKAAPRRVPRGR
jgi:very-short-patch-repair endonuclease